MHRIETAKAMEYLYPQPVAFLTTAAPDGRRNVMAVGWLMQASLEPTILAVGVSPRHYTHQLIEQTGVFAISLAGQGQADLINRVGSVTGRGSDKFADLHIDPVPGPQTGCPLINGAAVHFECAVENRITVGDHSVFFGRVLAAWVPDAPIRKIDNFGSSTYAPAQPAT